MTTDEFIVWAMDQPETERHELAAGEIVAMSPERLAHFRTKIAIFDRLREAIAAAGLSCEAFADSMSIEVDSQTLYVPDVGVRCGERLGGDTVKISDPLIVVEVLSASTRRLDAGVKLADYFRLPSLRHYILAAIESRTLIHHRRAEDGSIAIVRDGRLRLDPPGIDIAVAFP